MGRRFGRLLCRWIFVFGLSAVGLEDWSTEMRDEWVDSRCRAACMKAARLFNAEEPVLSVPDAAVGFVAVELNWPS